MTVPHLTPAAQASTAPAAFAAVRASGLRLSTARRLLLHALFDSDRPLSAEELAGDGDVASAYRNLEVLEGLGLVRHVHLGHGPGLYQPAGRPREFVLCESCGEAAPLAARGARPRARGGARRHRLPGALHPLPDRRPVPGLRLGGRTHADAHPRRADAGRVGAGRRPGRRGHRPARRRLRPALRGRRPAPLQPRRRRRLHAPGSASPPTRWACATPSTPTTSPPSTTRRASSCRRASGRSASASSSRSGTRAWSSCWRCCSRSASRRWPGRSRTTARRLHSVTGLIGTGVSGTFLYVIAALNLVVLWASCGSSATCAAGPSPRTSSRTCCSRAGS